MSNAGIQVFGLPLDAAAFEVLLAKAHASSTTTIDPKIRRALLAAQNLVRERPGSPVARIDVSKRATRTSRGSTPTSTRST